MKTKTKSTIIFIGKMVIFSIVLLLVFSAIFVKFNNFTMATLLIEISYGVTIGLGASAIYLLLFTDIP